MPVAKPGSRPAMMRRIKIKLAYDGGAFHGWQVQPGLPTIQGSLEEILSAMEGRPVHVAGSGRTDAGVHALEQVAAFTIANPIPVSNLRRAVNRLLPPAIRVLSAEEVHSDFIRASMPKAKTYEYRMLRDEVCSPFEWPYVHHYPYPLDEARMIRLAAVFTRRARFHAVRRRPTTGMPREKPRCERSSLPCWSGVARA
jgi:tRNA pseudouridine38-40 synthase